MMLTCAKCGRRHPVSDDDVAAFYPRFFCLSCGEKLNFDLPEAKILELKHSNDRARKLAAADLQGLPPADQPRRVVKRDGGSSESGG
jgi:hypothetical protein